MSNAAISSSFIIAAAVSVGNHICARQILFLLLLLPCYAPDSGRGALVAWCTQLRSFFVVVVFFNCRFRVFEDFVKRKNNNDPLLPTGTKKVTEGLKGGTMWLLTKCSNKMISYSSSLLTIYSIKTHKDEKWHELKKCEQTKPSTVFGCFLLYSHFQVLWIWVCFVPQCLLCEGNTKGFILMPLLLTCPMRQTMRIEI